jgi:hypothetical protein
MRRRHKAPAVFLYTASEDKKESAVFSREGDDKEHFLPIAFTKARRRSRLLQVPRGGVRCSTAADCGGNAVSTVQQKPDEFHLMKKGELI